MNPVKIIVHEVLKKDVSCQAKETVQEIKTKNGNTDLLFYHRDLQCLIAFELKADEF